MSLEFRKRLLFPTALSLFFWAGHYLPDDYLIPIFTAVLLFLFIKKQKRLNQKFLVTLALLLGHLNSPENLSRTLYTDAIPCQVHLIVTEINSTKSYKKWKKEVRAKILETDQDLAHLNLKGKTVSFYPPDKVRLPKHQRNWRVKGSLRISSGRIKLKAQSIEPLKEAGYDSLYYRILQKRYALLKDLQLYFERLKAPRLGKSLLSSLATGITYDKNLKYTLNLYGLNHLIAISGFHFLVVSGLFWFCIPLRNLRIRLILIAFIMSLYAGFIGLGPSVFRAWLMLLFTYFALLSRRLHYSLNTLGLAVVVILLTRPDFAYHLGFILSFLSTLGILFIFPLIQEQWLPQKPSSHESFTRKAAWWLAQATFLNLSISLLIAPVLLFISHKIPLLSFFANLIIPPAIALVLVALWILIPLKYLLPSLAHPLMKLLAFLSGTLIEFLSHLPHRLQLYFRAEPSVSFLWLYYPLIFFLFYFLNLSKKREPFPTD